MVLRQDDPVLRAGHHRDACPHSAAADRRDEAETLVQSEAAYAKAHEPKELFLIEGGAHFDFYDRPEYVGPAIAKIDAFLKQHL